MSQSIKTAIIGDQGFTTRRLPVSSTIPKGFTPIGNHPVLDFIIDDLVKAGITDIYFVIHPYHRDIYERYFLGNQFLDSYLTGKGKTDELEQLQRLRSRARFHFVDRIDARYGTTTPALRVFEEIGRFQPCVYLNSDDFTIRDDGGNDIADLIQAFDEHDAAGALLGYEVSSEQLKTMGAMQVESVTNACKLQSLIEKPQDPTKIPGHLLANIGKQIIGARMEPLFTDPQPNERFNEYFIVDLYDQISRTDEVLVVPAKGKYYDVGTLESWLVANNELANRT